MTMIETTPSRNGTTGPPDSSVKFLHFTLADQLDDEAADVEIEAELPAFYRGLILQDYTKRHVGAGNWDVEARYGPRRPREIGTKRFSFDTTGERLRITHSLGTVSTHVPAGATATDHKQAINVVKTGGKTRIEGTEVNVPRLSFVISETHPNPPLGDYVEVLFLKTGSVNLDVVNANINGLTINMASGECLFEGATGGESGVETYQIDKRFSFNPNQVNLVYGDITVPSKRGFDYLWVSYRENEDNNELTTEPVQVNVELIFPYHTHAELFA